MKKTLKSSFQPLTDHIEAMIASGYYSAETRIPPLRELCERFKLSRGTAARGLEYLRDRGVLDLRRGSGAYVKRAAATAKTGAGPKKRIAVFSEWADPSSYCGHILLGIQRQAAALNFILNIHLVKYIDTTFEMMETAARANDALLLLGGYDTLARLPDIRPAVGVDMHKSLGFASLVGLDPVHAAELATGFFRRRGCGKVKVFGYPLPLYRFRAEVFASCFRAEGGEVAHRLPMPEHTPGILRPEFYDRLVDEFDEPGCGYLFVSGTECERTMAAYRRATGRLLTDEHTVLSIDGKSLLVPDYLPVSTITPDYCEIGSLALQECMRRIDHPGSPPRRIMVNGAIYEI